MPDTDNPLATPPQSPLTTPPQPSSADAGASGADAGAGASPGGLSVDVLSKAFERGTAPLVNELRTLSRRVEGLESSRGAPSATASDTTRPAATAQPGAKARTLLERLVEEDSDTVINEAIDSRLRTATGPLFQILVNDRQREVMSRAKDSFSDRYGDDTWKEVIEPRLEHHLKQTPEHLRASDDYVTSLVAAIKGHPEVEDVLYQKRSEHMRKRAEDERARPTQFVGAGRPRALSSEPDVTEDDRTFFHALKTNGVQWDEKRYQLMRAAPKEFGARVEYLRQRGLKPDGSPIGKGAA